MCGILSVCLLPCNTYMCCFWILSHSRTLARLYVVCWCCLFLFCVCAGTAVRPHVNFISVSVTCLLSFARFGCAGVVVFSRTTSVAGPISPLFISVVCCICFCSTGVCVCCVFCVTVAGGSVSRIPDCSKVSCFRCSVQSPHACCLNLTCCRGVMRSSSSTVILDCIPNCCICCCASVRFCLSNRICSFSGEYTFSHLFFHTTLA